ncbi:MAG: phage adaptor protein [Fluviibacter sp.]|jgi:hypothetical protein
MAYVMTFDSLKQDIRRYIERGFTAEDDPLVYEQIPRLINMAERRIARELKVQILQTVVTTAMQAGVSVYPKPDRWRDTVSMNFGGDNRTPLFTRSYEYCRNFWQDETVEGTPQFYCDYDYKHWLIVPTPDAAYDLEILYYELPPLLDDENQQNWLTDFAPNLLLYGSLLEATPFLKDDGRIQTWQGFYDRAAQTLNGEDLSKILDRNAQRMEA